jgi:hypothetical protein
MMWGYILGAACPMGVGSPAAMQGCVGRPLVSERATDALDEMGNIDARLRTCCRISCGSPTACTCVGSGGINENGEASTAWA